MTTDGSTTTTDDGSTTTTDDGSTTTGTKDRPVATLLSLGTYQGMTDSEIKSVIDWYVEQSKDSEESKARATAIIEEMNTACEARRKAAEESNDILKQLVGKGLQLTTISSDTTDGGDS